MSREKMNQIINLATEIRDAHWPEIGDTDPTPEPDTPSADIIAWRGESVYIDGDMATADFEKLFGAGSVKRFAKNEVETRNASFQGARIGAYKDALVPVVGVGDFARLDIPRNQEPGLYQVVYQDQKLLIEVLDRVMPEKPAMPMYMEIESFRCLQAYFQATGELNAWAAQGPQTKKYIDMLRSFWIEPTKQAISHYPTALSVDAWGGYDYSYEALVFDGAIAPPLLWAGDPWQAPPAEWVRGVSALANGRNTEILFYGIDEAGSGPSGASVADAIERVGYLMENGGGDYLVVQTGLWHGEYRSRLPNISFWPVRNIFDSLPVSGVSGLYGSCMATGNCVNTSQPNPRTPHPVHVLEGHPENDWERSILEAHRLGANYYMHFAATKNLLSCWQPGGLYNEGGNGDGTHFYFDPDNGDPIPSIRLAHYHKALQQVTKLRAGAR